MTSQPSPRLVIDTNIFVPGLVGATATPPKRSASAGLLRAWRADFCSVIVSEELLAEYLDVLQRPAFGVARKRAFRLCEQIAARAIVVTPPVGHPLLEADPDDDMVLKAALAGKADLLVTDNKGDFAEIATLPGGTPDLRYRGCSRGGPERVPGYHSYPARECGLHHASLQAVALMCPAPRRVDTPLKRSGRVPSSRYAGRTCPPRTAS